jgi:hypothetical protein
MKVYLAGPMSNLPQFNFPAFFAAADALRAQGHEVFNPAEEDIKRFGTGWWEESDGTHDTLPPGLDYRNCLRVDLNWILDHAEAIALIPGWEKSSGVKAELALAKCLKLTVLAITKSGKIVGETA